MVYSNTVLTMFMHKGKSLEDLVGYISYSGLRKELGSMLDHLVQVLFHVLKDKVELVVLSYYLTETDNVGVFQLHQRLHVTTESGA